MTCGWLNINKPENYNSTQIVRVVKSFIPKTLRKTVKVGHAGTLDPFASGVLPIAIGKATKAIPCLQEQNKEYIFEIKWGEETDTLDYTGKITNVSQFIPNIDSISHVIKDFIGKTNQSPPKFSAIKIDGVRAYKLARDGKEFVIKEKEVDIYSIDLVSSTSETTTLRAVCGSGTYIRSLARDIANKLGTCCHLVLLQRTNYGPFNLENSISIEEIGENVNNIDRLIRLEKVIPYINIEVGEKYKCLLNGATVKLDIDVENEEKVLCTHDGIPIAIAIFRNGILMPHRVFNC